MWMAASSSAWLSRVSIVPQTDKAPVGPLVLVGAVRVAIRDDVTSTMSALATSLYSIY